MIKRIGIMLVVILCGIVLNSCDKSPIEGLKQKDYDEMIEKYADMCNVDIENIKFNQFYGEYNDAYVVELECMIGGVLGIVVYEDIAGLKFKKEKPDCIVYYNDVIYSLKDAYGQGVLSKSDIEDIYTKTKII